MSRINVIGAPWTGKGAHHVTDCKTSEEVMIKAGLNFQVDKCELVAKMPFNVDKSDEILDDINAGNAFVNGTNVYRDCPNTFATYRTDTNIPLGNVKSKYEVVQNNSAFKFFDDAIGKDKAIWQTAGAFGRGERVFVTAKLPSNILVKGDVIENYLVFSNSHDGSSGVNILFTPIRVVCQNTLNAAIRSADCYVRFRHTASVHGKILTAQEILGISKQKISLAQEMFEQLANHKYTDEEAMNYFAATYLTESEIDKITEVDNKTGVQKLFRRNGQFIQDTGISTRKINTLCDTLNYYLEGPGQADFRGTAYGAYNAVTGYFSNVVNMEGLKRMDNLLYGNANKITQNSLAML